MNSAAGVGFRYNGDPCIGIGIGIGIGTIDAMFTIGVSLRFE